MFSWFTTSAILLSWAVMISVGYILGHTQRGDAAVPSPPQATKFRRLLQGIHFYSIALIDLYSTFIRSACDIGSLHILAYVLQIARLWTASKAHADWTWENDGYELMHKTLDILFMVVVFDCFMGYFVTKPPVLVVRAKEAIWEWVYAPLDGQCQDTGTNQQKVNSVKGSERKKR